jgi:hypothetical protein
MTISTSWSISLVITRFNRREEVGMETSKNSYFNGLRDYQKRRSINDVMLLAFAEDMDNWSELREEQEDHSVKFALRCEATEKVTIALKTASG